MSFYLAVWSSTRRDHPPHHPKQLAHITSMAPRSSAKSGTGSSQPSATAPLRSARVHEHRSSPAGPSQPSPTTPQRDTRVTEFFPSTQPKRILRKDGLSDVAQGKKPEVQIRKTRSSVLPSATAGNVASPTTHMKGATPAWTAPGFAVVIVSTSFPIMDVFLTPLKLTKCVY